MNLSPEDQAVLYAVFATSEQGRRALAIIDEFARTGKSAFHPESERLTCHNLGKQAVPHFLRDNIKTYIEKNHE
ncbi:MAG: hypothetical protein Q7Q73_02505 [Verrucomicrobiota bacterium JB024]|nr:hypothetical protein [Verrucomicrobiota bacterium JB024]